jgi:hypothetical protein
VAIVTAKENAAEIEMAALGAKVGGALARLEAEAGESRRRTRSEMKANTMAEEAKESARGRPAAEVLAFPYSPRRISTRAHSQSRHEVDLPRGTPSSSRSKRAAPASKLSTPPVPSPCSML